MIVAKIQVTGAIARTVYRKVIPAGIIGAQVEFEYDEDVWSGLHKTVVFRGSVTKDVVTDANIVTLPPEIAEKPRSLLSVGVYGVDTDGNLAIPTIWADLGIVRDAANPSGDATTDPSLPVWTQIQSMIGNLEELDTAAKNNLVAAVNEALTKGGGAVDEVEIRRIVNAYLEANPPAPGEPGKSAYERRLQTVILAVKRTGLGPCGGRMVIPRSMAWTTARRSRFPELHSLRRRFCSRRLIR